MALKKIYNPSYFFVIVMSAIKEGVLNIKYREDKFSFLSYPIPVTTCLNRIVPLLDWESMVNLFNERL